MSDQAVLLPKWFLHGALFGKITSWSYTFELPMSILILTPIANLMHHSLCGLSSIIYLRNDFINSILVSSDTYKMSSFICLHYHTIIYAPTKNFR